MKTYHFIGIGGISMSALAMLLQSRGFNVQGSDLTQSSTTDMLKDKGIKVFIGHKKSNIKGAEVIVVNSAISPKNPELVEAKKSDLKVMKRGEFLGEIAKKYKNVIAVSGAHGKTTTTALIASIFLQAGLNPTVHIGGILPDYNQNYIIGDENYFITEACEYKDNFLQIKPDVAVVLNVESEHLDYFKTYENVLNSFHKFAASANKVVCQDEFDQSGVLIGKDFTVGKIKDTKSGQVFTCYKANKKYAKIKIKLLGEYNVKNALFAIAVADNYGISKESIKKGLLNFTGVKRRYECRPFYNGSRLIFDYAHHPTEIQNVLGITKKRCEGKLYVVFQPHTYSRTKQFFNDFLQSFNCADMVYVFKTYAAREEFDFDGDAKTLYSALGDRVKSKYSEDYNVLEEFDAFITSKDTVIVLGAGDFYDKCKY